MYQNCHLEHIKALRQKGYKIESYTKRGYRLLEEPDLLSPLAMKQILNTDILVNDMYIWIQLNQRI